MSDTTTLILVGIFGIASVGLVFAQYYAPPALRPVVILKRGWATILARLRESNRRAKAQKARLASEKAEAQAAREAWLARPCALCGWDQGFYNLAEEKIVGRPPVAQSIAEIAIILVILTPLTCGLALVLLFFVGRGGSVQTIRQQQCPNCGNLRPM